MTTIPNAAAFSISVSVNSTFSDLKAFADFAAKLQALMSGFGPVSVTAPAVQMPTNLVTPAPLLEAIKSAAEAPAAPVVEVSPAVFAGAGGPPADLAPKKGPGRPRKNADAAPAPVEAAAATNAPELPLPAVTPPPAAPAAPVAVDVPATPVDVPTTAIVSADDFHKRVIAFVQTKGAQPFMDACKAAGFKRASDIPENDRAAFLASIGA